MSSSVMLRMQGCGVSYGASRALHDVTLDVVAGQTTAILGVNGAGKTTTLNVMAGLLSPDRGELTFEGEVSGSTRPLSGIRDGVAFAPEGRRLFAQMSVADNLLAGAYGRRDRDSVALDLEHVYAMFPLLKERRQQKAGTLSGGEQQMAAIGRAWMRSPRLLLLDEPTLGLSPRMVKVVGDIIAKISETGLTTVIVEQSTSVALRVSTYAYVLAHGRVAMHGLSADLLTDGQLLVSYLGAPAKSEASNEHQPGTTLKE